MRRGFSIFLILFFGLGPLWAALEASNDSSLPPCCRRHGMHHCAMAAQLAAIAARAASGSRPYLAAPSSCPLYPGFSTGPLTPAHALVVREVKLPELRKQLHQAVILHCDVPATPPRVHAGRGPPSSSAI